jgi:pimeloyl-ACP methyl ester carboxylesterase
MTSQRIRTMDDGTRIARLSDGRDLAFLECGDPRGRPVFYFHGTPSSRYEGLWVARAAARHGLRLLPIDRPGMGLSTFQERRRLLDWPKDVEELADLLGLERFGIAGHSGGGAFTFAAAHGLAHRLELAIALCPWGPPSLGSLAEGLNGHDRAYFHLAQRLPGVMRAAFAPLGWTIEHWPALFLRVMKRSVSAPDREALERPGFQDTLTKALQEAVRAGTRGAAWEALICYQPWGFELREIACPIHVWAGDQDVFVSNAMTDAIEHELAHGIVHRLPGKGHLCVEHWEDAFAALALPGGAGEQAT